MSIFFFYLRKFLCDVSYRSGEKFKVLNKTFSKNYEEHYQNCFKMHSKGVNLNIHKRKRHYLQKHKYPHPNKRIRFLDNVCLVFSVLMPATTIPQIWKIFRYQRVEGLSLEMWILYTIGVIPFLIYGIVHKEKPLIVLNVLWLIAQIIIIVGILMYM